MKRLHFGLCVPCHMSKYNIQFYFVATHIHTWNCVFIMFKCNSNWNLKWSVSKQGYKTRDVEARERANEREKERTKVRRKKKKSLAPWRQRIKNNNSSYSSSSGSSIVTNSAETLCGSNAMHSCLRVCENVNCSLIQNWQTHLCNGMCARCSSIQQFLSRQIEWANEYKCACVHVYKSVCFYGTCYSCSTFTIK